MTPSEVILEELTCLCGQVELDAEDGQPMWQCPTYSQKLYDLPVSCSSCGEALDGIGEAIWVRSEGGIVYYRRLSDGTYQWLPGRD